MVNLGPFTMIRGYGWDVEPGTMEFTNLGLSQTLENKMYLCNAKGVVPISGMICLNVGHELQGMPCWGMYLETEWQVCAPVDQATPPGATLGHLPQTSIFMLIIQC